MKKKIIITLFTTIITSNHTLCMEQNKKLCITTQEDLIRKTQQKDKEDYLQRLAKKSSKALETTLKKKITKQDDMEYNSIPLDQQYDLLKLFIADGNMKHLSLCLEYKFNPNRYHKQLSLLHYAIKKHKPKAIIILFHYNADLIPLNKQGQTPLDYAITLKCQDCINAMVCTIEERVHALLFAQKHCQLTKHILHPGPCRECLSALIWQLKWHGVYEPLFIPNKQFTANSSSDAASDSYISSNS